jgi:dUTP pyrophosphatase
VSAATNRGAADAIRSAWALDALIFWKVPLAAASNGWNKTMNDSSQQPLPTEPVQLKFKRMPNGEGLTLPTYTTFGAAGMDICAAESVKLWHGQTFVMPTGLAVEVPEGYEIQVRSRSGLAAKHGVFVTNGIGTIDCDYRGEIFVILSHLGRNAHEIERGDRVAQLVLAPVYRPASIVEVADLSSTIRGSGGLGSTGR